MIIRYVDKLNLTSSLEKLVSRQAKAQFARNPFGPFHATAWQTHPIAKMIKGLAKYADNYSQRYGALRLSADRVLGKYWLNALKGIRGLLNGDLGGLDAGFTDEAIATILEGAGFSQEQL